MPALKQIVGNYCEILVQLDTPKGFYAPQPSIEEYYKTILRDLPRIYFASNTCTVEQIKNSLLRTEQFIKAKKPFVYGQGDFFGEVFTLMGTKNFMLNFHKSVFDKILDQTPNPVPGIHFAYIDDDGINCALGVSYLVKFDEKGNKLTENYPFIVHIKNTIATLEDRRVTCLAHPFFLAQKDNVESVEEEKLPEALSELINHKKISLLFKDIFQGDSLSASKFNELEKRFKVNANIDYLDIKKNQINDLSNFIKSNFSNDSFLWQQLQELKQQSEEFDFFKEENYEKKLDIFWENINVYLQKSYSENLLIASRITFDAYKLELHAYRLPREGKWSGIIFVSC